MSSAAVLVLAKEVAALADVPLGPERAAACNRPRRQCWDALASIQRSLRPLTGATSAPLSGWERDQAIEARDCIEDLRAVLLNLQAHDSKSGDSHWASTEYVVLLDEIELLNAQSCKLLGVKVEPMHVLEEAPEATAPVFEAASAKDFADVSASTKASSFSEGTSEAAGVATDDVPADSGARSGATDVATRRPVRLSVEELHEEYHLCKFAVDGTCANGCTVGGCALMVEAW
mmetsp:Transcript_33733/g.96916  ORF Transcript_33733/g.96916 Transcript_33733/m.96916 type:complete len:232 (-) Transcript_33733:210-905(-)|eukprot:CAMPEP_0176134492 /NCGR_PEP_ID=MMETSP0120_2-20121206/68206_1 /TAXON_ID=160619 /ORGANISM="Kryptoperidinium foliaceum, Strain CCMP 1326" /LENGTH=231 /DNA_ID=CAMNT_0017470145 /DNA_START=69 /DNA_END=764 /DNA_ORIENTATION=-